jgi:hypothetical protein
MNRMARVARQLRTRRAMTAAMLALAFGAGPLFVESATAQPTRTPAARAARTAIGIDQVEFERSFQVRIDRAGAAVHTNAGAQWVSPNHDGVTTKNWPVAYNMNTPLALKAQFFVTGAAPAGKVTITGTTTVGGRELTLQASGVTLVAGENLVTGFAPPKGKTATLPNMVTQMLLPSSPMTITWVVTTAANTTIPAGSSRHDLFVLYHANGSVFLTVVWHTTHGAAGKNTEADVAAGTWAEFSAGGNAPVAAFRQKQLDPVSGNISNGAQLHYYDPNFVGTGACHATTTEELLTDAHSIGQCASWAHLFQDSLTAEGITSSFEIIDASAIHPGATFVLVKNWNIAGCMPKTNRSDFAFELNQHDIATVDGRGCDGMGIPAQGDPNPTSWHPQLFVVKYANDVYDPAYGILQNNKATYQRNLAAYTTRIIAATCTGQTPPHPSAPDVYRNFTGDCHPGV